MKKIFLVALLILVAVPVFAAENPAVKGNFVITMPGFSYWKGTGDFSDSSRFSFLAMGYEPEVQYFFMDKLAIGGKVGYTNEKDNTGAATKTTSFGPLANYYFPMPKFIPYAGCGLLYESEKYEGFSLKSTILKLQGGAVYMLGKNLSVYGEVFLAYVRAKNGDTTSGNRLGMAAGVKAFF